MMRSILGDTQPLHYCTNNLLVNYNYVRLQRNRLNHKN
jgi:hypothetical protein